MIIRVCNRLRPLGIPIVVATDDKRIYDTVLFAGFDSRMTGECKSGTDRVFEAACHLPEADIYINVQGDEPLVDPKDVEKLIKVKESDMGFIIGSYTFIKEGEVENEDIVKVRVDSYGNLTEITRKSINTPYRQCGLYVFTKQELKEFVNSAISERERIELTRVIDCIRMVLIGDGQAVDRPEDIKKIEEAIYGAEDSES